MNSFMEKLSRTCVHCGKTFKSKAGLTKHINTIHLILSPSQIEQRDKYLKKLVKE